jgi:hypothetical protein
MENQNIQLVARQESYKLTVTKELETKIRFLCDKLPHNEWSGTLFYTVEGTFEDNTLHLYAKDFYLQDVGTSGFTSFQDDITLSSYMVDNDLLDCEIGLMHSHNTMATSWSSTALGSGTDMNTLKEEGSERNHFLSLIVNNAGTYSAAITRKVSRKLTGTAVQMYNTFGNIPVTEGGKEFETESVVIEFFRLGIEVESANIIKSPLELRLEELKASAKSYINKDKIQAPYPYVSATELDNKDPLPSKSDFYNYLREQDQEDKEPKQLSLFDDTEMGKIEQEPIFEIDKQMIHNQLVQLVTGNVFAQFNANLDLNKWGDNMEKIFDKRFDADKDTPKAFEYYADAMLETFQEDMDRTLNIDPYSEDIFYSCWAMELTEELNKIGKNKYIDYYTKSLERWIV